jgi:hypothetical protein
MFVMFRARGWYRTLTLALAAVVMTALTVAVAIAMLIVGTVVVAALFLARVLLPPSRWPRGVAPAAPWPGATIDATIVGEEEQSRIESANLQRMR